MWNKVKQDYTDKALAQQKFYNLTTGVKAVGKTLIGMCPKCSGGEGKTKGKATLSLWQTSHGNWVASCNRLNNCNHYISSKELFGTLIEHTSPLEVVYNEEERPEDWQEYNNIIIEKYLELKTESDTNPTTIRRLLDTKRIRTQHENIIIPVRNHKGLLIGLKRHNPDTYPKYKWLDKVKISGEDYKLYFIESHKRFIGLETIRTRKEPVILTEGIFDAHHFKQGISYDSATLSSSKIDWIETALKSFNRFWVIDRDEAGRQTAYKLLASGVKQKDILVTPDPYKDCNELAISLNKPILDITDLEEV